MKKLYDTAKKLPGKYSKPERPAKDKEGRPITEIQQQRNRWIEYFEELLNRPASMNPSHIKSTHTDLPIDINPRTTEKIRMAIRQIKNGKGAGPNNIPAEALKSDVEVLKFKAENNNPITLECETLENVESFTYLGSIIDEQGGYGCRREGEDWQSKGRFPTIEEHMQLKTTFNQYQRENLQYEHQDSQSYCTELKLGELQQPSSRRYKYL
ncbi:unnamed protein product [Schistosoma curassoni]|uniref:Uncharacterized protein n=1 Tax=Schistosoma curassoni TaxID=6186 RepID=A0A183KBQ2_9TREM|nr:unnamed protein product [Schistosoma curassoni]